MEIVLKILSGIVLCLSIIISVKTVLDLQEELFVTISKSILYSICLSFFGVFIFCTIILLPYIVLKPNILRWYDCLDHFVCEFDSEEKIVYDDNWEVADSKDAYKKLETSYYFYTFYRIYGIIFIQLIMLVNAFSKNKRKSYIVSWILVSIFVIDILLFFYTYSIIY